VPQIIKIHPWKILKTLAKALLAAIVMFVFTVFLKPYLNIFLLIPLAGCLYLLMLLLMQAIKKEDFISIYNSFVNKNTI
jgi:hypothetical protein